jgi:uncharacterized protein YbjT (DUF2867 family)
MEQKPIILVTGGTGGQGGSVVNYLLKTGRYKVRVLTRNPDSKKALALRQAGVEVVKGDLEDRNVLMKAMEGCYGVYGVTNFWEHFDKEYEHGVNLIDAVKNSGVPHFVFHTLPNAAKVSRGQFKVPHMDIKAELEDYTRKLNVSATFVHIAFYYENFLTFFPPQLGADGNWHIALPQGDTKLAGVAVEDIGGVITKIFDAPDEFKNKVVGIVGDDLSLNEYASVMTAVLKRKHVYDYVPFETYASFPFPGALELANMFEFNRLFIPERKADWELSKRLSPSIRSFEQWLTANVHQFQLATVQR